ncbi:hypothetical protein [Thiomicrorhabdus aquaedulcis]|nr:hypothetical protein [Thiomicrorhabdus aquaedulcis]
MQKKIIVASMIAALFSGSVLANLVSQQELDEVKKRTRNKSKKP